MSRWITNYEQHQFRYHLKNAQTAVDTLIPHNTALPDDVIEIARLKKTLKYVQETIDQIDPELVPLAHFDNLSNQFANIAAYTKQYEAGNLISTIHSANNHLDQVLAIINPVTVKGSAAARAAGKAFSAYAKAVEEHLSKFHKSASDTLAELSDISQKASTADSEIEQLKIAISSFHEELFSGSADEDALQDRIRNLESLAEGIYTKINDYKDQLFQDDTRGQAISTQIQEALTDATDNSEQIVKLLKNADMRLVELQKFYDMIFGKPSSDDEGQPVGGLKDELQRRRAELDKFKHEQEVRYQALNDEIETLLPGATSAGLTTAYSQMKSSFDETIKANTQIFYASILGLFAISLISITSRIYWFGIDWVDLKDLSNLWSNFAYKLPLALPVIWLAFFASKRRSEAQRLQQEYAHKEALAKSYQSYKTQIEQLGLANNDLMQHLLKSAIDAIAFNASTTLETKHGDKSPLHEALDKALSAPDALQKIIRTEK